MLSYNVILFNFISIILVYYNFLSFFLAQQPPPPNWGMVSSFLRFLDYTQRRTTVGKTPLEEWSARRRDLYLTTHNPHNRQTSMLSGGIRTHNLSRRAAAELRLRPRGHWDRHIITLAITISKLPRKGTEATKHVKNKEIKIGRL